MEYNQKAPYFGHHNPDKNFGSLSKHKRWAAIRNRRPYNPPRSGYDWIMKMLARATNGVVK